ncbi:hypothetical protein ACNFX6_06505 [Acinetobacter johnsonii]|uniref:hypothetical protein n=1 Tax=Acinetobacter johnsonii TaxID=40214 RepID=UPI001D17C0E2|nr:hypothetical protein [Acinetobacter johnsonii]
MNKLCIFALFNAIPNYANVHYFFNHGLIDKRKPITGMGWKEFIRVKNATLSKGTVVLVNGMPFKLAGDVETEQSLEVLIDALKSDPLSEVRAITNAVLDAQQELLKVNGSMVKEVVQGYERTQMLRTVETIAKLDNAKEKLGWLWDCFQSR